MNLQALKTSEGQPFVQPWHLKQIQLKIFQLKILQNLCNFFESNIKILILSLLAHVVAHRFPTTPTVPSRNYSLIDRQVPAY